jgi:RimJ/RimL family protein N-acetyltransferase
MISGKRIRLRAAEPTDVPNYVRWLNDPEVIENLLRYTPLSSIEEQAWFDTMIKGPAEEHALVIEVQEDDKWIAIGGTSFHSVDWKNRAAEIGIMIGEKKYWNRGYGRDTMRLMLSHGFNDLNLNRIYLFVFDTNQRAIKAYNAAGFVEEGRLRQDIYKNGRFIDTHIMSVLRGDWQDAEV